MSEEVWRPIHMSLRDDIPEVMLTSNPIHLALVTDDEPQKFKVACENGLGGWITGDSKQVTCPECLEVAHA